MNNYHIKHGAGPNINAKCSQGHQVELQRGIANSDHGEKIMRCKNCDQSKLEFHQMYYRCHECCENLCRVCALMKSEPPLLQQKQKFGWFHQCEMEYTPSTYGGWRCNAWQPDYFAETDKICESGLYQYKGACFQRYHCRRCDTDLCLGCLVKYHFVNKLGGSNE